VRGKRLKPALALLWACAIAAIAAPRLMVGVRGSIEALSAGWGHPSLAVLLANWGRGLAGVALAAAMLGCAWLAGGPLAGLLRVGRRDPRRFAARIPLGYGAASLALLGLLLVRLWFLPLLVLAFVVPAAFVLARGGFSFPRLPRPDTPMAAALVLLALLVPRLLAPEAHYDALTYSLAGPARWVGEHGLAVLFADYRVNFPMLAELPFALPLALGVDQAAGWLSLGVFLSGAAAALTLVPSFARGWGLLLLTATATMPVVISAKGDGAAAGFVLLALALVSGRGTVLAAAVVAGMAVGTKYSAPVALAWVAVVGWLAGRKLRMAHLAVAAVVALPWFVKSWLLTGDPLYPLLGTGLARFGAGLDARTAEAWRAWRFRYGLSDRGFVASLAMGLAGESALFLWALPFALVVPVLRWPLIAALAAYASWYAVMSGFEPPRLGFPVMAGAMVLAAGRFRELSRGPLLRAALGITIAVTAASRLVSMHTVGSWNTNPFPYLLGMEDRQGFFRRAMTTYADLAGHLSSVAGGRDPGRDRLAGPAGGRATVLAGEPQTWRLPVPTLQMVPYGGSGVPWFREAVREARLEGDAEQGLLKRFRRLNATRVVCNPTRDFRNSSYFYRFEWSRPELAAWAAFFSRWMELEYMTPTCDYRQGMYYVYRLRSRPREAGAFLRHLPGTEADFYRRAGFDVPREPAEAVRLAVAAAKAMPPVGFYRHRGLAGWAIRDGGAPPRPGRESRADRGGLSGHLRRVPRAHDPVRGRGGGVRVGRRVVARPCVGRRGLRCARPVPDGARRPGRSRAGGEGSRGRDGCDLAKPVPGPAHPLYRFAAPGVGAGEAQAGPYRRGRGRDAGGRETGPGDGGPQAGKARGVAGVDGRARPGKDWIRD
jgi:hypothetical protein